MLKGELMGDHNLDADGWVARLYKLNCSSWEPISTGTLRLANVPGKGYCMLLVGEDGLAEFPVSDAKVYQKQSETLVVWAEPTDGEDFGLSFRQASDRDQFFDQVEHVQRKIRAEAVELPAANMANLEEIHSIVVRVEPENKQKLAQALLRGFYIDDLFDLATQMESNAQLEYMFEIFLSILTLNHSTLTEYMLSTQWLPDLIFILSHDPKIPRHRRVDHKAFLCEKAKFKEVVPLPGTEVIELIHHSFMLQYLRDTIVIGILDDMTLSVLGAHILETNSSIFRLLQEEESFDSDLMKAIQGCTDVLRLRDLAMFLNQYFDLPKGIIDIRDRHTFFSRLASAGLFEALLALLAFPDEAIQLITVGLLLTTVTSVPIMMREFLLSDEQRESEYSFAEGLIEGFHTAAGSGEMGQFAELFRHLLDPCSMEEHRQVQVGASEALEQQLQGDIDDDDIDAEGVQEEGREEELEREERTETYIWDGKEQFMRLFYQEFMPQIISPIVDADNGGNQSHLVWNLKSEIADLMTYCLGRHGHRIKSFILSHQVLERLVRLLPAAPGTLALAIIRFFRAAVGMSDRYLDHRILRKNLFEPVVEIFRANVHRYNMINSAILELFAYVSEEEYRNYHIVKHLVEKYRSDFESASYAPCFKALIKKHEVHEDCLENGSRRTSAGQKRAHSDAFPDDDDDGDYFDMLSDGEQRTPPLDGLEDEDELEEEIPLPSMKRRRKEEEEEEEDPFSSGAQPPRKAPAARSSSITFSWGKANSAAKNAGEEAPSASEDSADDEPADAPSPLAAGASL